MGERERETESAHRFSPAAPDEEFVYGSCSPGWHSAADHQTCVEQWISFVQSEEIERVCCLLAGRHLEEQESNVTRYREAFGEQRVLHAPVPDRQLVDIQQLQEEILPFIEEGVRAGEPVVVQGLSGLSRTGQVLASWLIYGRDYGPTDAVDAVIRSGRDPTAAVGTGDVTRADLFDLLGEMAQHSEPEVNI